MPADESQVHTAAEILDEIDKLVASQDRGLIDVSERISRAIMAFDDAGCESHADALAYISMSRRLTQTIVGDIMKGKQPGQESVSAADRYMETALAFIRSENIRTQAGITRTTTMH